VLLKAPPAVLPEISTDLLDATAMFAVQNVRRDRSDVRSGARLGQWVGRMLGGWAG
jgi:hypothetical protein